MCMHMFNLQLCIYITPHTAILDAELASETTRSDTRSTPSDEAKRTLHHLTRMQLSAC